MNLTEKQLEQCRREFEEFWTISHGTIFKESYWECFRAAWRPIPSVEEIDNALEKVILMGPDTRRLAAREIRRAFGVKYE